MKTLAVIPARSGSRGLRDKNILLLDGRPLLAHSIETARKSGLYDRIHVSTDDERYAAIAREYGADVQWLRAPELATDDASSWDVVRWTLDRYASLSEDYDICTLLQPTSPFRTAEDLQLSYRQLIDNEYDAVIAVCELEHSPLWSNTLPEDLSLKDFIRPQHAVARQLLPTYYRINGAIYHARSELIRSGRPIADEAYAYIMPQERSIDIDTEADFKLAEFYLKEGLLC